MIECTKYEYLNTTYCPRIWPFLKYCPHKIEYCPLGGYCPPEPGNTADIARLWRAISGLKGFTAFSLRAFTIKYLYQFIISSYHSNLDINSMKLSRGNTSSPLLGGNKFLRDWDCSPVGIKQWDETGYRLVVFHFLGCLQKMFDDD